MESERQCSQVWGSTRISLNLESASHSFRFHVFSFFFQFLFYTWNFPFFRGKNYTIGKETTQDETLFIHSFIYPFIHSFIHSFIFLTIYQEPAVCEIKRVSLPFKTLLPKSTKEKVLGQVWALVFKITDTKKIVLIVWHLWRNLSELEFNNSQLN